MCASFVTTSAVRTGQWPPAQARDKSLHAAWTLAAVARCMLPLVKAMDCMGEADELTRASYDLLAKHIRKSPRSPGFRSMCNGSH